MKSGRRSKDEPPEVCPDVDAFVSPPKKQKQTPPQITVHLNFPDNIDSPLTPCPSDFNEDSPPQSPEDIPEGLNDWVLQYRTWPVSNQRTALEALLSQYPSGQVPLFMDTLAPYLYRNILCELPKELALNILSFLEPRDLCAVAQTCKWWRSLAEDNIIWSRKYKLAGFDPHKVHFCSNFQQNQRGRSPSPGLPLNILRSTTPMQTSPPSSSPAQTRHRNPSGLSSHSLSSLSICSSNSLYKQAFLREYNTQYNFLAGRHTRRRIMCAHTSYVVTCLEFEGDFIISGSDDETSKVWSATSGECLHTLTGHTGGVWASAIGSNFYVSGSVDRTLRVWDYMAGVCLHVLEGHSSTVRCLALYDMEVVSGSRDNTVRVWSLTSGKCLRILSGHTAPVRCVAYNGDFIVSGSYDNDACIWSRSTGRCLHTLQGHNSRIYSLAFTGSILATGAMDTTVRLWNSNSGELLHVLEGHTSLVSYMIAKGNLLITGNADATVRVWDIERGECTAILAGEGGHTSAITWLALSRENYLLSASDDGTTKLWNLKTGKFVRNVIAMDCSGAGGVVWRVRASDTTIVCAVGSRSGASQQTKLVQLNYDSEDCTTDERGGGEASGSSSQTGGTGRGRRRRRPYLTMAECGCDKLPISLPNNPSPL